MALVELAIELLIVAAGLAALIAFERWAGRSCVPPVPPPDWEYRDTDLDRDTEVRPPGPVP